MVDELYTAPDVQVVEISPCGMVMTASGAGLDPYELVDLDD